MKVGEFGIGAGLTLQGMEVGLGIDYDRVEIVVNRDGLERLREGIRFLDSAVEFKNAEFTELLARRNGFPCVLRVRFDANAKAER